MAKARDTTARRQGPTDVYTVMLVISAIFLIGGGTILALRNIEATTLDGSEGGAFTLVDR